MSTHTASWRPDAGLDALRTRADLLRVAREFFATHNVLEVETPALGEFGVTDPHISGIAVRLTARPEQRYFLQTSPEYAMKRLLAAGSPDIYSICKVFRDGELGRRHHPEFTMIEWYRRDLSFDGMIDETCLLIAALFAAAATTKPPAAVNRYHYATLFGQITGLDPLSATIEALRERAIELVPGLSDTLAQQLANERNGWLDLLMSHAIIPALPDRSMHVVHHYPAAQGALARLDPEDSRYAERFEIFFGDIELANGYRELTDPHEQRERFATDRRRRAAADLPDMQPDPGLLAALEQGLPECSGVAVGFDRVLMCALSTETINEVLSFAL